jgi:hypothetical protein
VTFRVIFWSSDWGACLPARTYTNQQEVAMYGRELPREYVQRCQMSEDSRLLMIIHMSR